MTGTSDAQQYDLEPPLVLPVGPGLQTTMKIATFRHEFDLEYTTTVTLTSSPE